VKRSLWLGLAVVAIIVAAVILGFGIKTQKPSDSAANQPSSAPTATASTTATGSSTGTAATADASSASSEPTSAPSAAANGESAPAATGSTAANSGTTAGSAGTTENAATTGQSASSAPTADGTTTGTNAAQAGASSASAPTNAAPMAGTAATTAGASTAPTASVTENSQPSAAASSAPSAPPPSPTSAPTATQQAALPPSTASEPAPVAGPTSPSAASAPSFDVVRVDPTGALVMAGRAASGSAVTVTSNGQVIGTGTADENGEWVILPTNPIPTGNHELALSAKLPDGRSVDADKEVMLAVPETGKNVAGETAPTSGGSLAVLVPKDDSGGAVVLQQPPAAAPAATPSAAAEAEPQGISSGALVLDTVDYDDKGQVIIGGRGTLGATIQVYLDNDLIGATTVDGTGRWRVTPTEAVAPRLHTLRVDQIGANSKVVARVESPFLRAQLVELPADQAFIVQPGNSLWRIARRSYGAGLRYTVIYQANREQIRNPDLIYPGQVFAIPPQTQTN